MLVLVLPIQPQDESLDHGTSRLMGYLLASARSGGHLSLKVPPSNMQVLQARVKG